MSDFIRNYNSKPSIIKDTMFAGVVGTGIALATNYGMQKIILKHPQFWTDYFDKKIIKLTAEGAKASKINSYKDRINLLREGKTNLKLICKQSLMAGGIWAGIYFTYKCIKSLLIRTE